jgi:chromosome segregation protein
VYLKYIEIYGFKSFANRTKIEFFPGISAIVGPNGVGKSNIVDAVKWCIGEMSSKSLRMPSMMDVIFNGTTKRPQMNLAEVTLVFDNSERKLNIAFDEVAVTRKIYRSEESEYFINRVACRLKDIRELFLDTGIGSNGYAIIDQGEIDEILLSNAIERREVFEEVSGISKYKVKKDETLKKLEKVEMDLSIVENSLALIEQQIKKLEQEAKRAKLAQKYREELRETEIANLIKTIKEYFSNLEKEKEKLKPVLDEISQIKVEIDQLLADLSSKELILCDKINTEKEIIEKISSVRSEIARIEQFIISGKEMVEEIKKQQKELDEVHTRNLSNESRYKPLLIEKQNLLDELKKSLNELSEKFKSKEMEYREFEEKIRDVDLKIKDLENEMRSSYQSEIEISNLKVKYESEIGHLEREIIEQKREIEGFSKNIDENRLKLDGLKKEIEGIKLEKEKLESDIKSTTSNRDILLERNNELEKNISEAKILLASTTSHLNSILAQAENDTYWVGTNEIINSQIEGVYGTLRDIIKFDPKDRFLVEDAFGGFIDSIVTKDRETAFRCIELLKSKRKGRAKFIIMDAINEVGFENIPFESKISFPQEFSNLIRYLLKNVTFNQTEVSASFWICGGVGEVNSNEHYFGEVGELKNKILEIKGQLSTLEKESEENNQKIDDLNKIIDELKKKISEIDLLILNKENEIKNLTEVLKNDEDSVNFLNTEVLNLESKKEEVLSFINKYQNELNELKKKNEERKKEFEELRSQRFILEKEIIERKGIISSLEHQLKGIVDEIKKVEREIGDINGYLSEIKNDKETYALRKENLTRKLEELEKNIFNSNIKLQELTNDLKELEIKKAEIQGEIENLRSEITRINTLVRENNDILKEQMERQREFELGINTIETKIEDIKSTLANEYGVNYEDVKDKYETTEVDRERIDYLKKRLENMGNLNMTAPEEYENLIKEYNEKKAQIDDLRKAQSDLKQAIAKINETTTENFRNTFNKVNEYFQKIYLMLFEGGEARLVLTDPDNILETGVEIVARPPGKKPVNISQLSGGEKSLVAIALLFSFFCVNPSPFCIMDEVDAALDEANIERFVKLLKEFSPKTQFIVITHNKRTMEISDRLYGVTMEELGVSKIISVDLKKAIDMTKEKASV